MSASGRRLRVAAIDDTADRVRSLRFVATDGLPLDAHAPGSHVFVECGPRRNAYSLTDGGDGYTISVRRDDGGHGGSAWIHDALAVGDDLWVSAPRCSFAPVAHARRSLYVAAGIGVTPLLAHIRHALATEAEFHFVYVTHAGRAAHLDDLRRLCGTRLTHLVGRAAAHAHLERTLHEQPIGTVLYACGPAAMLADLADRARAAGYPDERVQVEHFDTADAEPGEPFDVLAAGKRITVAADETLLEALLEHGLAIDNLCRQGVCGECRTPVRRGTLLHRDHVLTDDERAEGRAILCCVSRADGLLELDV